ncbi:hypothetical protein GCM10022221_33930 [Actinocorallia aurea]
MKRAFAVLLPAVLVVPLTGTPATAAAEFWKLHRKNGGWPLVSVESFGKANTWFYGDQWSPGTPVPVWRWNGKSVVKTKLPVKFQGAVHDMDFASRKSGWAVGSVLTDNGKSQVAVMRWNGKTWRMSRSASLDGFPDDARIKALSGGRAVVTGLLSKSGKPLEWRFSGGKWKQVVAKVALRGLSGNYAIGVYEDGYGLARLSGGTWKRVEIAGVPAVGEDDFMILDRVDAPSAKDVWVTAAVATVDGSSPTYVLHWNGKKWTRSTVPLSAKASIIDIAADGRGGLLISAETAENAQSSTGIKPRLLHLLPSGAWKTEPTKVYAPGLALVPGTKSVWAVGVRAAKTWGIFTRGGAK